MNKIFINIISLSVIAIISLIISFYASYDYSKITLSTERFELAKNNPQVIESEEGRIELAKIQYTNVKLEAIPRHCIDTIVKIEDKNFWTNNGIDTNGLARLTISALSGNRSYGGGSTISQQVVKMSTDRFYQRGPFDKLKEIIWAYRLNQDFGKEEILERYLNNIYLGRYNYGVEAASQDYFGKSVSDLDEKECTYLMILPQSPNTFLNNQGLWDRKVRDTIPSSNNP